MGDCKCGSKIGSTQIKEFDNVSEVYHVGESVDQPLKYYDNNANVRSVLLNVMQEFKCKK